MSNTAPTNENDAQQVKFDPTTAEGLNDIGLKVQTFISPKDFLPGRDPQWAKNAVHGQPQGTMIPLGRLAGRAVGSMRKTNMYKGEALESIWLTGDFTAFMTDPDTGEIKTPVTASACILPKAMATKIEATFQAGAPTILLDLEIAIEATGGMVDYSYNITMYPDEEAQAALRRVMERMDARAARGKLARDKQKALTAS